MVFEHERAEVVVRTTRGHGGTGLNQGFLRDSSLLAVVVVTDEDDCSSRDLDLYDISPQAPGFPQYPIPLNSMGAPSPNLQCPEYRGAQYDVDKRYVAGLLALRPDASDLLVFAVIAGVQRKTKMNMEDSKKPMVSPSAASEREFLIEWYIK